MAPTRKLNVVITADSRGFRSATNDVDRDADRLQKRFSVVADSASGLSARFVATAGSLGQLVPMIASATPALAGLGGVASALGASFASAAAGVGALGVGFGASMAPILVVGKQVSSRFDAIKDAYTALQKAQQDHTEASKKAAQEAMSGLSKNEQAMARSLGTLQGLQQKVLGGASDRIFGALAKAIPMVAPALEKLAGPFNRLGDAIAGNITRVASVLTNGPWSHALKSFIDSAGSLVRPITTVFIHIGDIMRDIAVASLPMVQDAISGVAHWFYQLDRAATTSKIRDVVKGLVDQAKSWFGLFSQIAGLGSRIFSSLFGDGAKRGQSFVDTLTNVIRAVNHFIDQLRDGSGAGGKFAAAVKNAFEQARAFVQRAITAVRGYLVKHQQDIDSVVDAVKLIASAARDVFQNTLLPIVRRVINSIVPILQGLADTVRGVIRTVSGLLSGNWSKAWDGAKEAVSGAWKVIKNIVANGIGGLWDLIKGIGPTLVRLIVKGLEGLGKSLATGLYEGIKAAARALPGLAAEALSGIGHMITGAISKGLGKINIFGDGTGKGDGLGVSVSIPNFGSGGSLMGANPAMSPVAGIASRFGLHTSSGLRPGAITTSGNVSYHSSGEALDEAGTPAGMMGFFNYMKNTMGGRLAELIYGPGQVGIKNGRPFNFGPALNAQHMDHVHVAVDLGTPGVGVGDGIGQIKALWTQAGGSASAQNIAAAIAMAESGGNPSITHRNSDGSIDRGLWQINSRHGALSTINPLGNARAAVSISSNGRNWHPWTTYDSGAYKRFLSSVTSTPSKGSSKSKTATKHVQIDYGTENPIYAPAPDADSYLNDPRSAAADFVRSHPGLFPGQRSTPAKGFPIGYEPPDTGSSDTGPTEFDYLDAALAQAEATPDQGDDRSALQGIADYRFRAYQAAVASGDPRQIAQARRDLTSTEKALQDLTAAVNDNTAVTQQQLDLARQQLQTAQQALNVSNSQSQVLTDALTDVINRALGTRLGIGLSGMRAPAGSVARA